MGCPKESEEKPWWLEIVLKRTRFFVLEGNSRAPDLSYSRWRGGTSQALFQAHNA